ncbi:MAG: potassium channel family protein [Solirubrobacterales bacterium]|nr:potassium channel family protein [Solirubrobacterales bacterium]
MSTEQDSTPAPDPDKSGPDTGTIPPGRSAAKEKLWEKRLEKPMLVAAVLVIPALLLDNPRVHGIPHMIGTFLNVGTWLAFVVEFVIMLSVVPSRKRYLRDNPIQIIIVFLTVPFLEDVFDSLRILRIVRVLRLFRLAPLVRWLFSTEGVSYIALAGLLVVFAGGEAFSQVEGVGFWNSVYWSVTTFTSTGYGDISPKSAEGRALASLVMLIGSSFVAVITGALAELFLRRRSEELERTEGRLLSGEQEILSQLQALSKRVEQLAESVSERKS